MGRCSGASGGTGRKVHENFHDVRIAHVRGWEILSLEEGASKVVTHESSHSVGAQGPDSQFQRFGPLARPEDHTIGV